MIYFCKPYKHLPGYLHRFSLLIIGRLHIRFHVILSPDGTPYIHRHPFSYASIVLTGGYVEQVLVGNKIEEVIHGPGAVILRKNTTYHRIKSIRNVTRTLFISWSKGDWDLITHKDIVAPEGFRQPEQYGLYKRLVGGKEEYALFEGVWKEGRSSKEKALIQKKPSIHQVVEIWSSA